MSVLDLFRLDGKTALVTGCRRGIGKGMAIALAEAGADIVGVSKSLEASGSAIECEVTALGRTFRGYQCDFADRAAVSAMLGRVNADVPVIDILVNNAGTVLRKPAVEHPDEYWDIVLNTNLNAQWLISREIGKRMVADRAKSSHRVPAFFSGRITVPGYAASKGAIALRKRWPTSGHPKEYR
jgi:2-deoxy-D-gluconate 3-dehydrogenase